MTRPLIIHPDAAGELNDLYDYIAEHSGPDRAWGYVSAIKSFLVDLCATPSAEVCGAARWTGCGS